MTWWENSNYVEEFSIFDGVTNDHWTEWEDCTAWWKFLWDGDLLYLAIKVYEVFLGLGEASDHVFDQYHRAIHDEAEIHRAQTQQAGRDASQEGQPPV